MKIGVYMYTLKDNCIFFQLQYPRNKTQIFTWSQAVSQLCCRTRLGVWGTASVFGAEQGCILMLLSPGNLTASFSEYSNNAGRLDCLENIVF